MKKKKKRKKKEIEIKKIPSCSSTCSTFYSLFFPFFPNQTQHLRTQTHHKNTKENKKQIIISHSFIDEPKLSHSFPTRTTILVSRPKEHDHSKSRSTLTVSRPKQHDLQDKPQQNPARPKQNDRSKEERHCFSGGGGLAGVGGERGQSDPSCTADLTHHAPPI